MCRNKEDNYRKIKKNQLWCIALCFITGFDQKTKKRGPYSNVNCLMTFSLFDDNEKKNCLDWSNPEGMTRL